MTEVSFICVIFIMVICYDCDGNCIIVFGVVCCLYV